MITPVKTVQLNIMPPSTDHDIIIYKLSKLSNAQNRYRYTRVVVMATKKAAKLVRSMEHGANVDQAMVIGTAEGRRWSLVQLRAGDGHWYS